MTMVFVGLKSDFWGYWLRQISQCKPGVNYLMHGRLILWSCVKQFENV